MNELIDNQEQEQRVEALEGAMAEDEELREDVESFTRLLAAGKINLAAAGGFSEDELEGGYSAAVAKVESEQPAKALKILGTLMMLNPQVPKYYRLAGIALHRLKKFELADLYYHVALAFDPTDPIAMLYRGETHLLMDKRVTGRQLLQEGVQLAAGRPDLHNIVQRAKAIAQAFGIPITG